MRFVKKYLQIMAVIYGSILVMLFGMIIIFNMLFYALK